MMIILVEARDDLTVEEESNVKDVVKQLEKFQEESTIVEEEKLVKKKVKDKNQLNLKTLPKHLKYVFCRRESKEVGDHQ